MITETEGRKTISDSVAMKDEAKKGKSILERYNKSYRYTVLIGVAVMIGAFFIAVFISRSYKAVTQNMVSISNLEKSFTTVNGNVNMAYLFLFCPVEGKTAVRSRVRIEDVPFTW